MTIIPKLEKEISQATELKWWVFVEIVPWGLALFEV
jgi:hypothetical protein